MALTRFPRILIAGAAIVALGYIGFHDATHGPGAGSGSAGPRRISFRDLVIDAQALADNGAYIEIEGIYEGLGDTVELLYSPQHTVMGFSDDSIRLLTEKSSREVRELLYRCRQKDAGTGNLSGCSIQIAGHMGVCYFKINENAKFPCLYIEQAVLR
jgi:hypothetical protein